MIYRTVKGIRIPALGFGTFRLNGPEGEAAVRTALETGYRHIDTAIGYTNETEVGRAIAGSGISRDDIFITTKIWTTDLAPDAVERNAAESLKRLRTDRVDLLLIHWPNDAFPLGPTLAALARLRDEGRTRAIGVSNFPVALMKEAVERHGADLLTNQVEYHPFLNQKLVIDYAHAHGISVTAYLPVARGAVLEDPVLKAIGAAHGKSAAQVSIRWLLQQDGILAIPRSGKAEHIRANFEVFDFELSAEDMARIDALRGNRRFVDPDFAPAWDPA